MVLSYQSHSRWNQDRVSTKTRNSKIARRQGEEQILTKFLIYFSDCYLNRLLDSLSDFLATLYIQSYLQKMILMVGIQGALQNDPIFDMPTDNCEGSFELLFSSQHDIGWSHLLRGRFSRHWIQIQQDHIDHEDEVSSKKFTGQHWLQDILNNLWIHLYLAWKLYYTDIHGIDTTAQEAKRKAKLKPKMVAIHKTADKLELS